MPNFIAGLIRLGWVTLAGTDIFRYKFFLDCAAQTYS